MAIQKYKKKHYFMDTIRVLTVWIRFGQHSVGSDLGLCLQRLTADNKILRWQAKTIMKK